MSSLTINGDTSGSIVLQAPAAAGSPTVTLPTSTGTLDLRGPAFSAYQSSAQTLSSGTFTVLQFQTKEFDTDTCYSTSTYQFTPNVAGYYYFTVGLAISSTNTYILLSLAKNGTSETKRMVYTNPATVNNISGSALIYLNGTTDYVCALGYIGSGQASNPSSLSTFFQGFMARGA